MFDYDKAKNNRFLEAQERSYEDALKEIRNGMKTSHWMWYIFPQIKGLGSSPAADYYALDNLEEAKEYLADATLRHRLLEISNALLELESTDAKRIFGFTDSLKLRSSMTLFAAADPDCGVFKAVLDKFYGGEADGRTLELI